MFESDKQSVMKPFRKHIFAQRWSAMLYPSEHCAATGCFHCIDVSKSISSWEASLWSSMIQSIFRCSYKLWLWFPMKPPPSRRSCHQVHCRIRFKFKIVQGQVYNSWIHRIALHNDLAENTLCNRVTEYWIYVREMGLHSTTSFYTAESPRPHGHDRNDRETLHHCGHGHGRPCLQNRLGWGWSPNSHEISSNSSNVLRILQTFMMFMMFMMFMVITALRSYYVIFPRTFTFLTVSAVSRTISFFFPLDAQFRAIDITSSDIIRANLSLISLSCIECGSMQWWCTRDCKGT